MVIIRDLYFILGFRCWMGLLVDEENSDSN